MSRSHAVNPDRQTLLKEAANWLVRLDVGKLSAAEQHAFTQWYQSSAEHERVWQAACQLNRHFASLPPELARPVLARQRLSRRTVLKSLAGLGVLLPLSVLLNHYQPWQPILANYRTVAGQRRTLALDDGSELTLNTNTALDVVYDNQQRHIRLYQGELFVRTAKDPQRPFTVVTAQGGIQALGTEFAVRCLNAATQVTVTRHAVLVAPKRVQAPQRLNAGQQCRFTDQAIVSIDNANPDSLAWRTGELIVDNWRLDTFVQELARYRPGVLRCDPDVASLNVSGVFQTNNTEQALDVLQQVFKLKITRFTDYWVSIGRGF